MRAFILRCLTLIRQNLGNVILMSSRHSADTFRLREFLGRNGHPHTYMDLDTDKQSQELLDHFAIKMKRFRSSSAMDAGFAQSKHESPCGLPWAECDH